MENFIYPIIFFYLAFEAGGEWGAEFIQRHLAAKKQFADLKNGGFVSQFLYAWKVKVLPAARALLNYRVLIPLLVFTIHHHYTLELLHKLGDYQSEMIFQTWTDRGFLAGIVIGGLFKYYINALKSSPRTIE